MEETPRSSKRRKLDTDTPARSVSTPVATSSTRRASGKLAAPPSTNGKARDSIANGVTPKRSSRLPKTAASSKPTPIIPDIEIDLYDDIEGALGATSPAASKKQQSKTPAKKGKAGVEKVTEDSEQIITTPKSLKAKTPRARGQAKVVNTEEALEEQEATQEPEEAPATIKKGRVRPATTPAKEKNEELHDTIVVQKRKKATPRKAKTANNGKSTEKPQEVSTTKKRRARPTKAQANGNRDSTDIPDEIDAERVIPDSEEEVQYDHKSVNGRRRTNRTDHINNDEEEIIDAPEYGAEDEDAMDIDGNSVVGSVLDPTEPSPFNKPTPAKEEEPTLQVFWGNLEQGRELDLLKTVVLERITGKRPSPLVGLDDEYKFVHQLVEHTITAGEGNSMLVIGARGTGKTALVNKVLSEVSKDNSQDYHVIRLNGFTHTDDKIALREIWRQLGKEMDVVDDGSGPGKNYADTLTTLLALLSHPSDHTGEVTDQVAKAVIFIMDEFDLFAQHPRQTLLYNLFDIAQSRKAPIAVLGLTTRIDVANALEKRVKSRFSHRYVHLSLARTFTAFQEICKACLTIQPYQLSVEERVILEGAANSTPGKKRKCGKKGTDKNVLAEWNDNINMFFSSKSFLTQHLAPYFYRTKSVASVLQSFLLPTATLGPDSTFVPTNLLSRPDSKLSLIPHLSTLALSLLISTARLDIIHDSDTCNFNMAYDEYVTLASKARIQSAAGGVSASGSVSKVWGKDVARREWENLVELGLIMPVMTGQISGFSMVRADICLEEIGAVLAAEKGIDKGLERWCKQL